jgi:hypothetical protein
MPFLFFFLPRPLPCGSGDRWRAAQRSFASTPVPVPPGFRQVCPTAIPIRTRHLRELPRRSCSGDQRARVRGPSEGRVFCRRERSTFPRFSRPVHALRRVHADVVPFLSALWTSAVAGAFAERGGDPFSTPDRTKIHVPTLTREGQRHPVNRDAFHRCARVRRPPVGLLRRTNPARRSLAHAAHTFSPSWGECLHGPCKHQSAVTRDPWHSRNKRLCYRWVRFFRICRAWD